MQRCPRRRRRRQPELTLEPRSRSTQSRDVFFLRGLPYFALNENVILFSGFFRYRSLTASSPRFVEPRARTQSTDFWFILRDRLVEDSITEMTAVREREG